MTSAYADLVPQQSTSAYDDLTPGGKVWDVIKSAAVAPLKGIVNLAGTGGNLRDLSEAGQNWIASKFGVDPKAVQTAQELARGSLPFMNLPSSADIMPGYDAISSLFTGSPLYQPQTRAGKVADLGVQTATTMGRNWLTAPAKTAALVAGTTGGGSLAAGLTNDNPWATMLGMMLGGGPQMLLQAYKNAPAKALAQATGKLTPEEIAAAIARQNQAAAQGVPLLGPESLPDSGVQQLASDVAATRPGAAVMRPVLAQRPNQVRAAVKGLLGDISQVDDPMASAAAAQNAATGVISDLEAQRGATTRPLYQQAQGDQVPAPRVQAIVDAAKARALQADPKYAAALNDFASSLTEPTPSIPAVAPSSLLSPNGAPLVAGVPGTPAGVTPRTSVGPLSDTFKRVRNQLDAPAINATSDDRIAQGILGPFNRDLQTTLSDASPSWQAANSAYQNFTRNRIEPVTSGPVGIVAGRTGFDPAAPSAVPRVTSVVSNADLARPEGIRDVYTALNQQNPAAFPGLVRTWLQNEFDNATQRVQAGENRMMGANFAKGVFGTDQQRANFAEAMRGVAQANGADPEAFAQGAQKLMDTLQSTGRVPGVGSPTGGRVDLSSALGTSPAADIARSISTRPLAWLGDRISQARVGISSERLAQVFTAPDSVQQIVKMAKLDPKGLTAQYYAAALLGLSRGAAMDQ